MSKCMLDDLFDQGLKDGSWQRASDAMKEGVDVADAYALLSPSVSRGIKDACRDISERSTVITDPRIIAEYEHKSIQEVVDNLAARGHLDVQDCYGRTALIHAAEKRDARLARMLVRARAAPDLKNNRGLTALMIAAENNDRATARELVSHASLEEVAGPGEDGTALLLAARHGSASAMAELIQAGSDLSFECASGTALHVAVEHGNVDCVELLLRGNSDVRAEREDGLTSLHIAADKAQVEAARALVRVTDVDDVNAGDYNGFTALMYAACRGCAELVALLLSASADVNAIPDDGDPRFVRTALGYAADLGHVEVGRVLVQAGARVRGCDAFMAKVKAAGRARERLCQTLVGTLSAPGPGLPAAAGGLVAQYLGLDAVLRA